MLRALLEAVHPGIETWDGVVLDSHGQVRLGLYVTMHQVGLDADERVWMAPMNGADRWRRGVMQKPDQSAMPPKALAALSGSHIPSCRLWRRWLTWDDRHGCGI